MKNPIVSFDFDGTLSEPSVQKYAKYLVDNGIEVWITTRRFDSIEKYNELFAVTYNIDNVPKQHNYLFEVAEAIGISLDHIIFTNMQDKCDFIKNRGFIWHLDDDYLELELINSETDVVGISVYGNYKHKCNKLLWGQKN